jgi:hypothetical protein
MVAADDGTPVPDLFSDILKWLIGEEVASGVPRDELDDEIPF